MAQLVKFTTEPHKYFAERKEQFWPLNLIISSESFELKKNFPARNTAFKKVVSKVIGEYIEKNSKDVAQANARGSVTKRQRTVADILTLALIWQRNVEREIDAMIRLSKNIAEIILNTEIESYNSKDLQAFLSSKLRNFFHINLYLPEHIQATLPVVESLDYYTHDKEAQLKIFINQEEHIIDLSGLNIRRIISSAVKNASGSA